MWIILRLLINAGALLLLPRFIEGIIVDDFYTALFVALVLAFVNAVVKPIVKLLTLPITILTLGIFSLVINALFFWGVAGLISGFIVEGFWPAFWGAFAMSIVAWFSSVVVDSHA